MDTFTEFIYVVCIYDDYRNQIHGMVSAQHDDMIHEVLIHDVAFHNNERVLCGQAYANDIRVFYALRSVVVVVCNDHNDDGSVACILHDVAYAPHSVLHDVVAYALHSAAVYALRNAVFYALHNMVCALVHDVMDNELDQMVFHMYLQLELVMLTQSP